MRLVLERSRAALFMWHQVLERRGVLADYGLVAFSCVIVFAVIAASFFGLDFSDEGFYLNWIAHPEAYSFSYTHFGFVYGPVFDLLGHNVAWLRAINSITIFLLSWAVSYKALTVIVGAPRGRGTAVQAFAFAASVMLWHANYFLPTPSYNSGIFTTLLGALLCVIYIIDARDKQIVTHWLALGVVGVLAVLFKPTSAIALGVIVFSFLAAQRRLPIKLISIAGVSSLVLLGLFAIIVDGSIAIFIQRIRIGTEILLLRDAGYGLQALGLENFFVFVNVLTERDVIVACVLALLILGSSRLRNYMVRPTALIAVMIFAFFLLVWEWDYKPLGVYGLALGAALALVGSGYRNGNMKTYSQTFAWSGFILALPLVYAVGTNNSLWWAAKTAIFFAVLAVLVLYLRHFETQHRAAALRFFVAVALLFTSYFLFQSAQAPYRQDAAIWEMRYPTQVDRATLYLSRDFATFVGQYRRLVRENGFERNGGIIDLTGRIPTMAFLLGGVNIGTPWMNGLYKGGTISAKRALELVNCKRLHASWVITEPGGPRELTAREFESIGIFRADYELVGSIDVPDRIAGHRMPGPQYLYKPIPSKKNKFCKT